MTSAVRRLSLILILILIISFGSLSLKSTSAQLIPKPSVPEFSLSYVVRPYDLPAYIRINPYTGENETLSPEIHTTRSWVDITIENQQFQPYTDPSGNSIILLYKVSLKGHFENTWHQYPDNTSQNLFNASTSDTTVISVSLGNWPSLQDNSQLDFRIEALIGHYKYDSYGYFSGYTIQSSSGWSDTKTITVYPDGASPTQTQTSSPTPSPTVPEFSWLAILPIILTIPIALAIVIKKAIGLALCKAHGQEQVSYNSFKAIFDH